MATRASEKPALYAALALLMSAAFLTDLFSHPGVAAWIFYLVPVSLCLLSWRPSAPLAVAALTTGLMAAGYLHWHGAEAGIQRLMQINRCFGVVTIWAVAFICQLLIVNKIKITNQEWLKAGQNGLALCTQGEQPLGDLGREVLAFVVEYAGAQVGTMYAADDGGGLVRCAAFARVGKLSPGGDVFMVGEGLVGQAALDKRVLVVNDVPDDYVTVRSGLGDAPPRSLILIPARADGEVNGVLELGFFSTASDAARTFLESTAETIGVALKSAKYRTRQAELVEETKRQAEELRDQQEELRDANEELEDANAQLREQTRALELQRSTLLGTETTLRQQAVELERSSRYKSEFLANMSHELRTPLNSSLILARLLGENRGGNLTPEQVRYAESIASAGNDLLGLINDILDLAKIEAGKLEVVAESVAISRLVETLKRRFEPLAADKQLKLSIAVEPSCPEAIETDSQRVQQILTNLLSNSVKFTERGSIQLLVGLTGAGRISFTVEDTGIGISSEQHEVIFHAFMQADGTTNRRFGGTGLGLSISRELAGMLGGEILLTSTPGKGSSFTLVLPLRTAPTSLALPVTLPKDRGTDGHAQEKPGAARPLIEDDRGALRDARRVILVIEDDPVFARILRDLAHELGYQCIVAGRGDEGLRMARERPTAVVLDIALPDQSGLAVLELLKRDPSTRHLPIHVVSAHDYQQVAREMGAIGYVLKPAKREQLVAAFSALAERIARKAKSLLIVEDDQVQRGAITDLLTTDGVDIVAVGSAEEALVRLRAGTFDCVVLDMMLPEVSGFELLDMMSKDDCCTFPPVIVYTARSLSPAEEQRLRRFSKSIIVKGARSPERLLEEVTLFLHQVEAELSPEKQKMLRAARDRDGVLDARRILLVEDDARSIFAVTSVLESRGATVDVARNGKEALMRLDKGPKVDLVLMDVMMPEMDGLSATLELRKNDKWSSLPVIALTAKAMPDDRQRCLAAGANDYIAKPLDVDKFMSLLRVWMPR